jgi:hypothetical protein
MANDTPAVLRCPKKDPKFLQNFSWPAIRRLGDSVAKREREATQWRIGPFRLDLDQACLWRGDERVGLRPKPFDFAISR